MVNVSISIVSSDGVNMTIQGAISDAQTLQSLQKLTEKLSASVMSPMAVASE